MRLDGALKPRGAPTFGRSVGAERHQPNRKSVKSNESKRQIAAANVKTLYSVIHNFHDLYKKVINTKSKASKNENSTNVVEYFTLQEEGESRDVKNNNQSPIKLFSAGGDQKKVERKKAAIKMAPPKVTLGDDTNSRGAAKKLLHFVAKLVRVRKSLATATNNADDCGLRFVRRRGYVSTLTTFALCLFFVFILLPNEAICDEGDNGFFVNTFSMGPETTTPEFDYASRGKKKFGDKCDNTLECGFPGSICDVKKKSCQCTEDLPITNHIDKCGKEAAVNESCFFNEQCESFYFQTECRDGRCICRFDMTPLIGKDGVFECKGRGEKPGPGTYIDPAMIGVLVAMAVMFIIICVVLRLFSQARWRENRTIFNTPNPRLMNVSLLRDSKLLHGQERRGSRMSVRAPSRQPSMASLRPHSPNPSLGSHGSGSNASATSVRSVRSNSVAPGHVVNSNHDRKGSAPHHHHHQHQHQHHHQQQQQQQQQQPLITNITPNPVADNVTVEIIKPEK